MHRPNNFPRAILSAILFIAPANLVFNVVRAQPSDSPISFETASVKPSAPGSLFGMNPYPGGRFTASNISLRIWIEAAYGLFNYHELSGAPSWIDSAKFDINASAGRSVSREELAQMLQSLLAERFQLKAHRETKESPVYVLVISKGGSKLQPADNDPATKFGIRESRGRMTTKKTSMKDFTERLSRVLRRPVSDETGLEGNFAFTLEWTPMNGPSFPSEDGASPAEASGPSIFTAVQQLGLKLEARKGTAEVLVIDHVEPLREN